jgi:hypothetical protein
MPAAPWRDLEERRTDGVRTIDATSGEHAPTTTSPSG